MALTQWVQFYWRLHACLRIIMLLWPFEHNISNEWTPQWVKFTYKLSFLFMQTIMTLNEN